MKDLRTGTIWRNQGGAGIDQTGINPVGPDARPMATDLPADCVRVRIRTATANSRATYPRHPVFPIYDACDVIAWQGESTRPRCRHF